MRRPIIAVLSGFTCGILIEYYVNLKIMANFACLILLVFSVLIWQRNGSTFDKNKIGYPLMLIVFSFFVGALLLSAVQSKETVLSKYENEKITVVGRVISVQKKEEEYHKATIKIEGGEKILVNISGPIYPYNYADLIGRNIRAKGIVEAPSPRRNPKTFDYALYLKTRGISSLLKSKSTDIYIGTENINLVTNRLATLKYRFTERLNTVVPQNVSGILIGMLFGDKSLMDEDTYSTFQKNGIAHILSVSGIHVGIVYAFINIIFGRKRSFLFAFLTASFLMVYAALAEFSPSVVRAVTMILVHIFGKLTFQRYDLTCCTSACALAMLAYNPLSLFNIGFQLSYLAVFTLGVALPWTIRRIEFLREGKCPEVVIKIFTYLAPLTVIQLGMAPYTAYCFNYVSLGAFLLNIPIIFIAGLIIPIGIISMIISAFCDIWENAFYLFRFSAFCQSLLVQSMEKASELFYNSGVSYFLVVSPPEWLIILYYGLMFFLLSEAFRVLYQRKKLKEIRNIILIILITSFVVPTSFFEDYSHEKLIFVDVGQGDCLHLKTPGGKNILIDGGGSSQYNVGEKTLLPYLLKNGVREIDLAIVSHLHDDHYLGLAQLGQNIKIKKMALYEVNKYKADKISAEINIEKDDLIYLVKGDVIKIEGNISVEILYPQKQIEKEYLEILNEEKDENKSSLIAKVIYDDISILMTGDMGFDGEDSLIKLYGKLSEKKKLQSHVLKVGHHGSKYSTSDKFIEVVNPKFAVFQVGKNNFGHPNEGVIEKFSNSGIMISRNDMQGAVMLTDYRNLFNRITDRKKEWHIRTMIKGSIPLKK